MKTLVTLTLLILSQSASAQMLISGRLSVLTTDDDNSIRPDTVVLKWVGPVANPMAKEMRDAFELKKAIKSRVILDLSSPGGSTAEGAEVIALLREIKTTHTLVSVVQRGEACASMCVPIFLQGSERIAARTSSWMFHGARRWWTTIPDAAETERNLVYFRDAGVNEAWLQTIITYMKQPGEYWQSGGDLIDSQSGIITKELPNHRALPAESLPFDPQIRSR